MYNTHVESPSTMTVAQRRAIFEQNIKAEGQPQKKKLITTTTVTVTLTKSSPVIVNSLPTTSTTTVSNKSSVSTDNVNSSTITLTANKYCDATVNTNTAAATSTTTITNNENIIDTINTPPRNTNCHTLTSPPLRRTHHRSEPRYSGNSSMTRHTWTPPCIKNVLLKKQLIDDLNDEPLQIHNNMATSSPLDTSVKSPAGQIIIVLQNNLVSN